MGGEKGSTGDRPCLLSLALTPAPPVRNLFEPFSPRGWGVLLCFSESLPGRLNEHFPVRFFVVGSHLFVLGAYRIRPRCY